MVETLAPGAVSRAELLESSCYCESCTVCNTEAVRATFHYDLQYTSQKASFEMLLQNLFVQCLLSRNCAFFQVPAHQELYAQDNMEELSLKSPALSMKGSSDVVNKAS